MQDKSERINLVVAYKQPSDHIEGFNYIAVFC